MTWNLGPEERFQIAVVKFLHAALPAGARVRMWPNGGYKLSRRQQMIFHAMGLRAGTADLFLFWQRRLAQVELKTPAGVQSQAQREWQGIMEEQGFDYAVCRSLEEVEAALRRWGWPLRAAVQSAAPSEPAKPKRPSSRQRVNRASQAGLRAIARSRARGTLV